MKRVKTFVDSSILISATRGKDDLASQALAVLDDPSRDYVTSDFVRLEVLPKAIYERKTEEKQFYEEFFAAARTIIKSSIALVARAQTEAEQAGLSAVDALHVTAAKQAQCAELITAEKLTSPLFRVAGLKLSTIRPQS